MQAHSQTRCTRSMRLRRACTSALRISTLAARDRLSDCLTADPTSRCVASTHDEPFQQCAGASCWCSTGQLPQQHFLTQVSACDCSTVCISLGHRPCRVRLTHRLAACRPHLERSPTARSALLAGCIAPHDAGASTAMQAQMPCPAARSAAQPALCSPRDPLRVLPQPGWCRICANQLGVPLETSGAGARRGQHGPCGAPATSRRGALPY